MPWAGLTPTGTRQLVWRSDSLPNTPSRSFRALISMLSPDLAVCERPLGQFCGADASGSAGRLGGRFTEWEAIRFRHQKIYCSRTKLEVTFRITIFLRN
jgi:hypothetical protein